MLGFLERFIQWLSHSAEIDENQTIDNNSKVQVVKSDISNLENAQTSINEKPEKTDSSINTPIYQSSTKTLQQQLNDLQNNATLSLCPPDGEYAGPIIINNSVILDGQGATIWATHGPVLSILSEQVSLRNLRIEVTGKMEIGNSENNCAILVKSEKNINLKINLENIEVRGSVMGLSEEEGEWEYPSTLDIGRIAHGQEYNFRWRLIVPVNCKIVSEISGIEFNPHKLNPGANEINIHVEKLPQDTLINGSIYLHSANFKRRIAITAHIVSLPDKDTVTTDNDVIWEAETWATFSKSVIQENLNDLAEKEAEAEPLPKPDSVNTENNNETVSIPKIYIPVKPNEMFIKEAERIKKQLSQIEATDISPKSSTLNRLFQLDKNTQPEIENDSPPASSQESNSSVINHIFQKNSPFSQPINQNQVSEKSSSQKSDSQTNSQAKKRTQAQPNNIFWGDGIKKEEPTE